MLFPTATFAIFFLIVMPLSWLTMHSPRRWRVVMITASYVFYSAWDWRFIFLLAGCTVWNQLFALRIWRTRDQGRRKALLIIALAGQPRRARLLQVLRLLRRLRPGPAHPARRRRDDRRPQRRPPRRDLVLHVHGDQLRRRRLSRRLRADVVHEVRDVPLLLPPPRRRPDRAPERARAPARRAARPAPRRHGSRLLRSSPRGSS